MGVIADVILNSGEAFVKALADILNKDFGNNRPKLLLLDEHTAALDPKTAKKVLDITEEIVSKNKLTTIMITHNMADAVRVGNRLIMMNNGKIIFDVSGEEKKKLTTADLLQKFKVSAGEDLNNDRMLLS